MSSSPRQPPAWSFLGCGCAALVLAVMLAMVGVSVLTYREARQFEEGYGGDPAETAARTAEVLPYRRLPDGLFPLGGLSVPFLFDLAVFTDLPPAEQRTGEGARRFDRSGFLYVSSFSPRDNDARLRRYFEAGPTPGGPEMELVIPDDEIGKDLAVGFESREVLGRGEVAISGDFAPWSALWVARRGTLSLRDERFEGFATLVYPQCGDRRRIRLGLWFAPAPEAAEVGSTLTGTPADPEALAAFLAHFGVCG